MRKNTEVQMMNEIKVFPIGKIVNKENSTCIVLSDRRASKTETNSTYYAFSVLVYSFLALIALIAVFNVINSISMSVSSRQRQYGIMRAIGLDRNASE